MRDSRNQSSPLLETWNAQITLRKVVNESSASTSTSQRGNSRLRSWGRSFFSRERLIAVLVAIAFLAVALFLGLRWLEWTVTFHPAPYIASADWEVPDGASEVWFTTKDRVRLHGWFFKRAKPSRATVIFFHGNAGNVSDISWIGGLLRDRGFNVLVFDYRGFGRSEGASTGEQSVYADADAAYDYVVRIRGVSPQEVVLYGQSLGTTAAVDLASRHQCGAIILESGLSSASDMATNVLPWMPRAFHLLLKNRFDSAHKLASVHCPVLITHGEPDPIIPTEQARKLFAAAHEPRKLLIFPGGGHNVFGTQGAAYLNSLSDFVRTNVRP